MMNNGKPEILVLFGGKPTKHVLLLEEEFKKLAEPVIFANYKKITFKSGGDKTLEPRILLDGIDLAQFKVIFFRSVGRRWELANLITSYLKERIENNQVKIIDPSIVGGQRYVSMKAYQMLVLCKCGLPVPKTIYGRLNFLKKQAPKLFTYPFILKRSEGGRGERVYLVENQKKLNDLVSKLLPQEKEEKKLFMAQEFIPNKGDLRILVLGGKILGAMKRSRMKKGEFRNNISLGGRAEVAEISQELKEMALKATKLTQLEFAGVDIVLRHPDQKPFIFEVNRAPQFKGFMASTGINVPLKVVEYLIQLKEEVK